MTLETVQLSKVGKTEKRSSKSPNSRKYWGEMSSGAETYAKELIAQL